MKKLATLLIAAGLVFGVSTGANAIDFKAKGQWIMSFDYGQHGNFTGGNGQTGYNNKEDEFEARQRIRLQLDAVASEALSGTVYFEIGDTTWGGDGKGTEGQGSGGAMGADGVQMGTRFVATHECDADIRFKQAFVDAMEEDIAIIKSPVGMPGRALGNEFITASREGKKKPFKCVFHCVHTCEQEKTPYCIAQALINAMKGNLERGFAFCGANVARVNKIISVHELMDSLQKEFDEAMITLSKSVQNMQSKLNLSSK